MNPMQLCEMCFIKSTFQFFSVGHVLPVLFVYYSFVPKHESLMRLCVPQLVDALKEQEEINLRLRQYMDKIILAILDHNPSILEIKG